MNKKLLKLIMELIFIFILPIAFILISVKTEVVNTYDENGNLLTTEKIFDFSDDSILRDYNDNIHYVNYLNFNNIFTDEINSIFGTIENHLYIFNYTPLKPSTTTFRSFSLQEGKYLFYINKISGSSLPLFGLYNVTSSTYITFNLYGTDDNLSLIYDLTQGDYLITILNPQTNITYDINAYFMLVNLTEMYGSGYEPSTFNQYKDIMGDNYYPPIDSQIIEYKSNNIISFNYLINYTWYSKLFNELYNDLQINNNIVLKLITTYIILWVIMFLVWHLLYRFVDFMVHLFDRKE